MNVTLTDWVGRNRWIWSAIGLFALWILLSLVTSQFSLSSLSGVAVSSSFLTIVAIGQTAVIATGRGNIDLSIGSVMTLSAFIALIVVRGSDANLFVGVAIALALGFGVGAVNAALVVVARIPAIIATLATGYVLATASLLANRAIPGFATASALREIASGRVGGVPIIAIIAVIVVGLSEFVLNRSVYGRMLSAVGQNIRAARLAGVRVAWVTAAAFVASATLASLTGLALGAYVGGAFLEMGLSFRLQSIGAVVLGGTLIFGGSATAVGTMFGSLLLILIVTTMQIAGMPAGVQDMVQGVVIIVVLALAGDFESNG